MRITKEFSFDAAHYLPRYHGRCERLHGHTWRMEVAIECPVGADGLAFDFVRLKKIVRRRVVDRLDHSLLNDTLPTASAEHIAIWAWKELESRLPLAEIRVWETPTSSVTYRGGPEPAAERDFARRAAKKRKERKGKP